MMKTTLTLFALGSLLLMAAPALRAQDNFANTNSPAAGTNRGNIRSRWKTTGPLGERALLPPGLKEKMHLTDEQKTELKPFEEDFAVTSGEFQVANQPRIEAAVTVSRQARESKDPAQIQAARLQMQHVWAGLEPVLPRRRGRQTNQAHC